MKQPAALQKFCIIEEFLKSKRFSDALEQLNKIDSSSFSPSDKAYYSILVAEAKLFLGDYNLSDILLPTIEFYKYSNDNEKFARAKFLFGWMLDATGNLLEARESLLESYAAYKRCDNLEGQAKALNDLAYVADLSGEVDSAISCLRQCIDIYTGLSDNRAAMICSNNLGTVYLWSGLIEKAIVQYAETEKNISDAGEDIKYKHYIRYGLAIAHRGDIRRGRDILEKVRFLSPRLKREKAFYYEFSGWVYNLEGNFAEAEKTLLAGLEFSLKIAPESTLISQLKRLLAD
ncbi:MAG: tetratricopeptide repeat protein, partial [candidate division Zixibacteria bacterium]|nr:tetratricopeptide repeat protein [candidate division Zixibacteria bacterium]